MMLGIYQRLAELWMLQKKRDLTDAEQDEFIICMEANVKRAWKIIRLENLSLAASLVNDTEWQHQICAELDKLQVE